MIQLLKIIWLPAENGKGFQIQDSFSRKLGQVSMDMTFTNKAMQCMSGFAIQLNKNSLGLVALQIATLQSAQTENGTIK